MYQYNARTPSHQFLCKEYGRTLTSIDAPTQRELLTAHRIQNCPCNYLIFLLYSMSCLYLLIGHLAVDSYNDQHSTQFNCCSAVYIVQLVCFIVYWCDIITLFIHFMEIRTNYFTTAYYSAMHKR